MSNETHEIYVLTQTPVHIGGEQEKHLTKGMDFLMEGRRVWRLNHRELAEHLGVDVYVNAMEQGKNELEKLIRQRKVVYSQVAKDLGEIEGDSSEIKMMVADGMKGLPYIPGSSLKGGLRSALFKAAGGSWQQSNDRDVFGQFNNSVMRFIGVSDLHFNHPGALINSKVFNPKSYDGKWEGAWKFAGGSGKNKEEFRPREFATALEVIPSGEVSVLRLNLKPELMNDYQRKTNAPVPRKAASLLEQEDIVGTLFQSIYSYTNQYLEKELAYYNKLGGDLVDLAVKAFELLLKANQPARPLLRLGFGSGFHAVTGDFQYADHLEPLGRQEYNKLRKSRRLGFTYDEKARDYVFHPLGFVQLLRPADAAPYLKRLRQVPERGEVEKTPAAAPHPAPSTVVAPAAAPGKEISAGSVSPKLVNKTEKELKKGVKTEGIVMGQEGNNISIRPLLAGYEEVTISLRYPAGMPIGTVVALTVRLEGKKLIGQGSPVAK